MTVPQTAFLAPVRRFQYISIALLVIALLGFIALAALVSRHFTGPLRKLCRGTEVIAAGNLDHRIVVRTGDEMEVLADKFNAMTERVAESRRTLESWNESLNKKVEERTLELRAAEALIRGEKQKLDDIVSSIGAELCLIGRDSRIIWANRVMADAHGGRERVVGRGCFEVLQSRDHPCDDCRWKSILESGQQMTEMLHRRGPTGEDRYQQVIVTPVKDADGSLVELLHLSVDVTEPLLRERAARRHLAQAEKLAALGQLAAGVAHDVANPLAAIKTTLQVMEETVHGDGERRRFVDRVVAEVDRLAAFLKRFTQFARPKHPNFVSQDVITILREVLTLVRPDAHKRHIEVCEGFPQGPMLAALDGPQIQNVILNLVLNALEACGPGDSITVSASTVGLTTNGKAERSIRIVVSDTGPGVKREILDHLFDPFFTTKPNGTGLGLAIAHQIILEHGGSIRVEPTVASGTSFVIEIPEERRAAMRDAVLRDEVAGIPMVPIGRL